MYIYEGEGKNRSEAEADALRALDAKPEEVTLEPVSGATGILGLVSRKPASVRVFAHENTPREVRIRGIVQTLIARMGLDGSVVGIRRTDDNTVVELKSKDTGMLIGKHGRTLDAIQFLVNLLVNTRQKEHTRIMLDVESYRAKREESLTRLARGVAARVHRSRQPIALDYMNPYERRIVHLALEEDERVYTKSDGNGVYKRVRVIPASYEDRDDFGDEDDDDRFNTGPEDDRD